MFVMSSVEARLAALPAREAAPSRRMTSCAATALVRSRTGRTGLRDAVIAGLTLPWNSGVVEGHVNRIKMLKRQMFGRAGFQLLRKRVLLW